MTDQRKSFLALQDADIDAYATGPDAAIAIPDAYLEAVLANLHGLHRHAEIVTAALESEPAATSAPTGPFEP
jgi:hypothetical protein